MHNMVRYELTSSCRTGNQQQTSSYWAERKNNVTYIKDQHNAHNRGL